MKFISVSRAILLATFFLFCNRLNAASIYVDISATGLNNGSSWTNAFTNPQSALTASVSGDTIFVATGTYKPDVAAPGNRNLSFNMKTGVVLMGGFPTGGSTLANRNWVTNPTIFSGDIGTIGTHTDNSYHVVRCNAQQGELNGFIVERGRADAAAPDNDGGGVFITSGYLMSRFCTYRNNFANDQGGGSYHDAGGNPQYRQCKFESNTAAFGGGSYAFASTIIANCTYIGNTVTTNGGGIYAVVNINMYNNTFRTNSAFTSGNAIYYQSGGSNRLFNSIVWGNTGSATHIAGVGSIELLSCIIQGGCPGGGATCTSILNVDPLFSDAAGHLTTTSPAVDAGNTSNPDFNNNSLSIDLDNNNRNFDAIPGGGIRDMGAYESQILNLSRYYVDHTATGLNNGSSWVNAYTSFQSAVATAASGDTVFVAAGTHKPSVGPARLKKYTLVNGVCYYGGFPNGGGTFASRNFNTNRTILSGDIGTPLDSIDNCFVVVDATNLTNSTLMSGFTIEEGNSDSTGSNMYARAGGIYLGTTGNMRLDSVTVRNNFGKAGSGIYAEGPVNWVLRGCIFDNNTNASAVYIGGNAYGSFTNCTFNNNLGFNGGAISLNVLSATFSFTNCSFTNNRATASGGGGAINSGQTAGTYTNCSFINNTALTGPGGALYKFYATANTFTNCTFTGNRAAYGGGALYGQGGFNLYQCVFNQNLVTGTGQHGGAIYNNGTPSLATNCVFWSNSTTVGIGGAIYNNTGGTFNLTNCTFAKNNAVGYAQGGGLNNNSTSNATISNCIFWGNLANNSDPASNTEIGHASGTLSVTNTIWQGNITGGTIYNVDPLFTNSTTGDLSLTMCSPAIDTGTSAGAPATDVVGNTRPFIAKPGGLNYDLGAYEFMALVLLPEVNVTGNGNSITDGDATPSLADHTDFGSQSVCNGTVVRTFTIENSGNGNLTVATPTISGPNAADFTVTALPSTTVGVASNTTFQVTFNPSGTGFRYATITFTNDDCNEPVYDFAIRGSGVVITVNPASQTNVLCFGNTTGAASVNATGGMGTLTYDWTPGTPTGDGTNSITGLTAQSYTCTVTDINACTATTTINITSPPLLVLTPMYSINVTCFGVNNGVASVQGSGGVTPYFVDWTPGNPTGEGTYTASGLAPGTYTCTLTDGNGCTASTSFTITEPPAVVITSVAQTNINCTGLVNGAASVVASGGTGSLSYSWTPGTPTGDGTNSVTGLFAGVWNCSVYDQNGCSAFATFTITQPPLFYGGMFPPTNVSCNGGSNGAATVEVYGGVTPYTYNWAPGNPPGDGTATATGLTAGSWTCTVTDANGCTFNSTVNVTQPTPITITSTQTNNLCFGGSNGAASVSVSGGTSAYSYNWTPGNPTGDGTASVTGLTVGTWTCTVTDANSCVTARTFNITQPSALVATSSAGAILCNGGTATVTVVGAGGTSPYTVAGTFTVPAGTYSYTVTDANGCTNATSITVTEPTALAATATATAISCNGGNATVTVVGAGGTSPYSGTGTFIVTAGTYSYTVTDANGCTNTTSITVTEPTALTAASTATAISCNGGNATVTVVGTGGTSPYTGTGTFTVTAGTYSYIVTDANGCTNTTSITVTEPTAVTATSTATAISCNGGNATVTVVGAGGTAPYTGDGSFTVTAGTSSYTVTDANGCTTTTSITVTEPTAISTTVVSVNVGCNGDSIGSIDLTVTGGTGPYTFDWNSGTYTTEDLTGLGAGTYIGVITDANGCTDSGTIIINEPAVLVATVTTTVDPDSCGATNGSIDITVTGGTIAYSYLWNTSATTEDLSGVSAGAYSCVVTDTNGCTANVSGNLNDPNAPTVTLALTVDTLCSTDAAFTLTGESPAGGTFSGPGVTAGTFDPAVAGVGVHTISYTFTDSSGCTGSTTDSIYVDVCTDAQSPVSVLVSQVSIYPNPNNGTFTLHLSSSTAADVMIYDAQGKLVYTQKVQPNVATPMNIESSGMYMVTVIDANGERTSQRVMVAK